MKLKKKTCGILAVLLLLMTVFTGMQEVIPVHAEGLKVSINGTELEDGRYYEFGGSRGSGTMSECDPAALPEAYIYYSAGIMEVKGSVKIYSNGGSSTEILKIENGTLTLKGDGNFYLTNDNDTETLVTGTADAVLKADEYTGDIQVSGRGGNALIKGLSLVDLKTAGEITLDADDVTGDVFISAGSVKLEADQLDIYLSGGAVKYLIEATDEQNGEISLKKTGSLNSFDLVNGNNINVTEAFFKAKDTFLSSNGNSNSNSSSGRIVLVSRNNSRRNGCGSFVKLHSHQIFQLGFHISDRSGCTHEIHNDSIPYNRGRIGSPGNWCVVGIYNRYYNVGGSKIDTQSQIPFIGTKFFIFDKLRKSN